MFYDYYHIATHIYLQIESEELLVGFCEHLENETPEETSKDDTDDEGKSTDLKFIWTLK